MSKPELFNARLDAPGALAVALLIGISSWLSIDFARLDGDVAIVWPASGLLLGILLTSPHRLWRAYLVAGFAGTVLARLIGGDALLVIGGRGVASTAEAILVAYAVRRFIGDVADPARLPLVARVALGSTLFVCLLSAAIAAASAHLTGDSFGPFFVAWFVSHSLGMIIFATVTVVARNRGLALFGRPGRRLKFARTIGLLAATTLWVFSQTRYPFLFLVFPPLLLAAFRHRFGGVAVGIVVIMVIAVAATVLGSGPFYLVRGISTQERILLLQFFIAVACLVALPVATVLAERGRLTARLRASEQGYRLLADHARDLVVRLRADGRRIYVSPSVREVLGWEPEELLEPRWDLVHPADRTMLTEAIRGLFESGGQTTVIYRALHKDGHYVWIEALARRVQADQTGAPPEIIYSGRDISRRVLAQQALADSERRIRAITDNMPAMIMHVDTQQKYTFVNAHLGRLFGLEPEAMLGRTLREVVDPQLYARISGHVDAALRGERITFEGEIEANGQRYYRQANYVPDIDADGVVRGMYSLTYDITELHAAREELTRIAQHDTLTGLGNRNKFNERLALALARAQRNARPLALICLDIDYFKQINDGFGHAVGDAVLCTFAQRLQQSVRATDLAVRLGGDEFAILVEDVSAPDIPEIIARNLIAAMQPRFVVRDTSLDVSTSIGVGFCRTPSGADTLMQVADGALYAAKAAGRNTYRIAVAD